MTTREQFEAWAEKDGMDLSTAHFIENAAYLDDDTDLAFRAWQASRAAALEEAAKLCEDLAKKNEGPDGNRGVWAGAVGCCCGIRAIDFE